MPQRGSEVRWPARRSASPQAPSGHAHPRSPSERSALEHSPPGRSRWALRFDAACILGLVGLWLWLWLSLCGSVGLFEGIGLFLLALVPGLLLADLATGSVHWFADRFLSETTPLIGPSLIEPFRAHHRAPAEMAQRSFVAVSGSGCLMLVPPMLAFEMASVWNAALRLPWLEALILAASFAAALSNGFHRWAHAPSQRVPTAVRWLQRRGVILTPARHALHHRGAHERAFCVTTGWLNPWLDRVHFFPILERRLRNASDLFRSRARRPRAARRFARSGLAKKVRPN